MAKDKGKDKDKKKKDKKKIGKQWVNYDYLQFQSEEALWQARSPWGLLLFIVKEYWNANCQVARYVSRAYLGWDNRKGKTSGWV